MCAQAVGSWPPDGSTCFQSRDGPPVCTLHSASLICRGPPVLYCIKSRAAQPQKGEDRAQAPGGGSWGTMGEICVL
eukprot:647859-Pelagomonas_calceolata.AAC.2